VCRGTNSSMCVCVRVCVLLSDDEWSENSSSEPPTAYEISRIPCRDRIENST
jgi:hypothetical protein